MSKAKTQATAASVDEYLASRASPDQLADCQVLMAMLGRVTGEAPRMWGPSIVGYGRYTYRYASGTSGESCVTGFAIRGRDLVVYLVAESPRQEALLARLGKHKFGKACLYLKRLADVDLAVLESLVAEAVAEVRRRHPATGQD
ncbi:MAG TPA: DUF1801 domain-containing protein [Burkholderiaceae bacterium]|nr:DUF1801 domain-containing protein [Burkholderiaceae bacterium]HRZ00716.1 DUF1801 domain-containing protein [Burkholderiaceae bacterium]